MSHSSLVTLSPKEEVHWDALPPAINPPSEILAKVDRVRNPCLVFTCIGAVGAAALTVKTIFIIAGISIVVGALAIIPRVVRMAVYCLKLKKRLEARQLFSAPQIPMLVQIRSRFSADILSDREVRILLTPDIENLKYPALVQKHTFAVFNFMDAQNKKRVGMMVKDFILEKRLGFRYLESEDHQQVTRALGECLPSVEQLRVEIFYHEAQLMANDVQYVPLNEPEFAAFKEKNQILLWFEKLQEYLKKEKETYESSVKEIQGEYEAAISLAERVISGVINTRTQDAEKKELAEAELRNLIAEEESTLRSILLQLTEFEANKSALARTYEEIYKRIQELQKATTNVSHMIEVLNAELKNVEKACNQYEIVIQELNRKKDQVQAKRHNWYERVRNIRAAENNKTEVINSEQRAAVQQAVQRRDERLQASQDCYYSSLYSHKKGFYDAFKPET